jgi:hypothetical protein
LARAARRKPGHTTQDTQIKGGSHDMQAGAACSRLLAHDCPARGHCVKGAYGVANAIGYRRPLTQCHLGRVDY